ncbi:MAG: putative tellurite resistance protein B-like protein [Halioglobus sp.]|jgi:uncharacterized tellurite resistance protein B-like protein
MIAALKALFEPTLSETEQSQTNRLHLVAAALLIETARADFCQTEAEQLALENLLSSELHLDKQQIQVLVVEAQTRVDKATSLYEFTREINDNYNPEQKIQLIEAMWKVAYADGNLGKYEEHLIRQVAELTYVSHNNYIRTKLNAKKNELP